MSLHQHMSADNLNQTSCIPYIQHLGKLEDLGMTDSLSISPYAKTILTHKPTAATAASYPTSFTLF